MRRDRHAERPPVESRIVGRLDVTSRRMLAGVDHVVDTHLYRAPHVAARWNVHAVVVQPPTWSRSDRGGVVIALRCAPAHGLTVADAGDPPWQELQDMARAIAVRVRAARIVPDVAAPSPVFVERLGTGTVLDARSIDELLSA